MLYLNVPLVLNLVLESLEAIDQPKATHKTYIIPSTIFDILWHFYQFLNPHSKMPVSCVLIYVDRMEKCYCLTVGVWGGGKGWKGFQNDSTLVPFYFFAFSLLQSLKCGDASQIFLSMMTHTSRCRSIFREWDAVCSETSQRVFTK